MNIREGIIYIYTSPSSKSYIGMTIQEDERKYRHKREAKHCRTNSVFHKAIRKYGFENFTYEILHRIKGEKSYVLKELGKLEIHYINKYDTLNKAKGYNLVAGGSGGNNIVWTELERKRVSDSYRSHKNPKAKDKEYYRNNFVQRTNFKRTCDRMGWNFDDFEVVERSRNNGGKITYKYSLKQ